MPDFTIDTRRPDFTRYSLVPQIPRELAKKTDGLEERYWPPTDKLESAAVRAMTDPVALLRLAVATLAPASATKEERALGFARADILVTGRHARAKFEAAGVTRGALAEHLPHIPGSASDLDKRKGWGLVWDRIDAIRHHLASEGRRPAFTPKVGPRWIATYAPIDVPSGPINVGRTAHHESTLDMELDGLATKTFQARYIVIGSGHDAEDALTKAKRVVLYLHGLGSRAEEAEAVAERLVALDPECAVLSPDLLWNGYTTAEALPDATLGLSYGGKLAEAFPALELLEAFVVALIEALGVEDRLACVAGGSLGATLTMRLTLPKSKLRIRRCAFWSPAGLWEARNIDGGIGGLLPAKLLMDKVLQPEAGDEGKSARDVYFRFNFTDTVPLSGHNWENWWSKRFLATAEGKAHLEGSKDDRLELYREPLRRMQFRLAYEQICFSLWTPKLLVDDLHLVGIRTADWTTVPLLLLCGTEDNLNNVHIWDKMKRLAERKRDTKPTPHPGRAVWLEGAGHSLHDECPHEVAVLLHDFIQRWPAAGPP